MGEHDYVATSLRKSDLKGGLQLDEFKCEQTGKFFLVGKSASYCPNCGEELP